jgi:predicted dehydrogenase
MSTKTHRVGIVMNGVTGRMGKNQHLLRSIVPIMREGGLKLSDDEVVMPDPVLVGRNAVRLEQLARESGVARWSTDVDAEIQNPDNLVYFDAQTTDRRVEYVARAIAAGKHIYCEKPTALRTEDALELYRLARERGVKHGVVQDKLWLPGLLRLKALIDGGFFGRILSVRGEFGYWVFEGDTVPAQRPSWNYRAEEGGGIIFDMFCHWDYVLSNLFGPVKSLACLGATHIDRRWDESGQPYSADADDAAYAIFELESGIIAQFNSSWATRVRRDDLVTFHVDGTRGSAVAGLRDVQIQPGAATPRPIWNPDIENTHSFYSDWLRMPEQQTFANAFRVQWELFLRHLILDEPFRWGLLEAASGVRLAEAGYEAWRERKWVNIEPFAEEAAGDARAVEHQGAEPAVAD